MDVDSSKAPILCVKRKTSRLPRIAHAARRRPSTGLVAIALSCSAALLAGAAPPSSSTATGVVKIESRFGILHLNLDPGRTTAAA